MMKALRLALTLTAWILLLCCNAIAQHSVQGTVRAEGKPLPGAVVKVVGTSNGAIANEAGAFELKLDGGGHRLEVSFTGYEKQYKGIILSDQQRRTVVLQFELQPLENPTQEVVVTGTMRENKVAESVVPVESFSSRFFKRNPTPSLYEAMSQVNGVQPTMLCAVCNTGDIRINGLDGAYTMILIDGMPLVSSLSTVYGLMSIPNSMVDKIEVVKGPASALYGSEALAGVVNIVTKDPLHSPRWSVNTFGTSYGELNTDVATAFAVGKARSLLSLNAFNYNSPVDRNGDGFTDVTLANRISAFNKWSFERKEGRAASIAARYLYEDRWGGDMAWRPQFRGGDSIYGESIYTNRVELLGSYQLPIANERVMVTGSYVLHDQNSVYGTTLYKATQQTAFAQVYWDKKLSESFQLLIGSSFRYNSLLDNTPLSRDVTDSTKAKAQLLYLPGVFAQTEWKLNAKHKLLLGGRYDYNNAHGHILTPRLGYKFNLAEATSVRFNVGSGFRVVNIFTEDHAALTGARKVKFESDLQPERSWNANLAASHFITLPNGFINLEGQAFYTYFTNKIFANFDKDPQQIWYSNLDGYGVSQGVGATLDYNTDAGYKFLIGGTLMDVFNAERQENGPLVRTAQVYAPRFLGNWTISLPIYRSNMTVDLTGQIVGPMRMPTLPNDGRAEYSPTYSLVNVQVNKPLANGWVVYGGIKNLLNYMPPSPLLRPFDPFDKRAGDPVNNPDNLTFDTAYQFAPLQGIRFFLGFRWESSHKH